MKRKKVRNVRWMVMRSHGGERVYFTYEAEVRGQGASQTRQGLASTSHGNRPGVRKEVGRIFASHQIRWVFYAAVRLAVLLFHIVMTRRGGLEPFLCWRKILLPETAHLEEYFLGSYRADLAAARQQIPQNHVRYEGFSSSLL